MTKSYNRYIYGFFSKIFKIIFIQNIKILLDKIEYSQVAKACKDVSLFLQCADSESIWDYLQTN